MPAATELVIAKACNKILQTSYLLPFTSLCAVSIQIAQSTLKCGSQTTQPLNHLWFAAQHLFSAYKFVLLLLQSLPLFALPVAAFTVQHISCDSFGQSSYINWNLVTVSNKGDQRATNFPTFEFSHHQGALPLRWSVNSTTRKETVLKGPLTLLQSSELITNTVRNGDFSS